MDKTLSRKIIGLVVADSRGRCFLNRNKPDNELYESEYIIRPGGRIAWLTLETVKYLKTVQKNDIVIIQICAGINDLTRKTTHAGGTEIIPNERHHLWYQLLDLVYECKRAHVNSIISFASIPVIDFKAAKQHYMKIRKLHTSAYTDEDSQTHQKWISDTVRQLNHNIHIHNSQEQTIIDVGAVKPNDLYWHQYVEKQGNKRKHDEYPTRRIVNGALTDGIHPAPYVQDKWYEATHNNFVKIMEKIRKLESA
jgi:hypothetical protein